MNYKLNLSSMIEQEAQFRQVTFKNPVFIMDSNAMKYSYDSTDARVVVTSGIVNEMLWLPDVFPMGSLHQIGRLLNPEVVRHFVSKEDEELILRASKITPKAEYRKNKPIGWADTQQIAYALELVREGCQVALVSNDGDIFRTVDQIVNMAPELEGKLTTLSVRKYFGRMYRERFAKFDGDVRRFLVDQVAKDYMVA